MFYRQYITTPLGDIMAIADEASVRLLDFSDRKHVSRAASKLIGDGPVADERTPLLDQVASELNAYFAGQLPRFSFPISTPGTPFQRRVWDALCQIPVGQTISYGQQAKAIGAARAVRAVAAANGQNFCAIAIPCHRVIGADGSLTGYGGGIERKRFLIDHERKYFNAGQFAGA